MQVPGVLLLNSYHQGLEWTNSIVEAVHNRFEKEKSEAEIYVEYMDAKRFMSVQNSANDVLILEYLRGKYRGRQPDILITSDDAALSFVLSHREELFPSVPVVFCGINRNTISDELFTPKMIEDEEITGVYERIDVRGTVELARQLQPWIENVVVVSDKTKTGRIIEERIREVSGDYAELTFEFISGTDTTTEELKRILFRLDPEDDAVLYNYWLYDAAGNRYEDMGAASMISEVSGAPVYSFFDIRLETGILGGSVVSGKNQGDTAARLALRVLNGLPASDIPLVSERRNTPYVDWRVFERYGMSAGLIPEDVQVIARPEGLAAYYRKYRTWIWIIAFLLLVETASVILLSVVNRQRKVAYRKRKEAEEVMVQTEKMVSVGGLAAGVAHEINNPLSGILQNMQLIRTRLFEDTAKNRAAAAEAGLDMSSLWAYAERRDIGEMTEYVRTSAQRASTIVKEMLLFSRKDSGSFESCDIPELMDKALELAAKDYNLKKRYDFRAVRVDRRYDENVPPIWASRGKLEQVFLNLIRNAAQAMQKGDTDEPKLEVVVSSVDGYVIIDIIDNGSGMDEDTKRRLFEPFYTTKEVGEGTGLGLFVSYSIVTEQHWGKMEVESSLGKGTKFRLYLPIEREQE